MRAAFSALLVACAVALLGAAPSSVPNVTASSPVVVRPADGGAPWNADDLAALRTQIDAQIAAAPTLRGAHVAIVARDVRDGAILYAKNADDYLRPASTMKLLTGSFALDALGPTYRFTSMLSLGTPNAFFAGNNPFLTMNDLRAAGAALADHVRTAASSAAIPVSFRIATRVSHWRPYRDGWTVDDFPFAYAAPIDPVVIDENAVRMTLAAGSSTPVIEPDITQVRNARCPAESLLVLREARQYAIPDPVPAFVNACGSIVLSFSRSNTEQTWHLAVTDPQAYAVALMSQGAGAAISDVTPDVPHYPTILGAPAGPPIWSVSSPPLAEVLRRCWYPSDNLIAEKLLDESEAHLEDVAATPEEGIIAELSWARNGPRLRLGMEEVADGSGMSQYDRLSANELAAILAYDWKSPNRNVVLDALPVASVSGTLESEYVGTPIAGRAFAKSGSLSHASNLAGYLATKNHGTVIFAFMVDDWLGDTDDLLPLRGAILGRFVDAP